MRISSTTATGMEIKITDTAAITAGGIHSLKKASLYKTNGTSKIKKVIDIIVRTKTITVALATGTFALFINIIWAIAPPLAPGVSTARK